MKFPLLIIKKYLPIFNAFFIFIFALLAIFLFHYSLNYFLIFTVLPALVSLLVMLLILDKDLNQNWPLAVIFPIFIIGFNLMLLFTKNLPLKISCVFLFSLFCYIFLITIFRFLYLPRKYPPYALENISFSLGFLTLAISYAVCFALINFLIFPKTWLLLIIFLVSFLGFSFIFWLLKIKNDRKSFLIISLILTQVFYSLTFLPTSFYINGIILIVFALAAISIFIRKNKDGILMTQVIKKHIFLVGAVLILILILAKWR